MTLAEIQEQILAVSANLAEWQDKLATASFLERPLANAQIVSLSNALQELKNQEQALLATQSSEQRSEDGSQESFLSKNKWWFIGGGVLLIGGIATFLILRRKNK
jgi:LPXTG-motif cell wall-anchored protein